MNCHFLADLLHVYGVYDSEALILRLFDVGCLEQLIYLILALLHFEEYARLDQLLKVNNTGAVLIALFYNFFKAHVLLENELKLFLCKSGRYTWSSDATLGETSVADASATASELSSAIVIMAYLRAHPL